MKRLCVAMVCGAVGMSASAAMASGGYITGDQSNPPRAVFSAPMAPVAAPPVYNPCQPATTTYMPVSAPAPCTSCAAAVQPAVAFAPVAAAPAPCTTCAPVTTFSPVVAAPAPCTTCAPAPVTTYSPVVAFSPVMVYSPVVAPVQAYAPVMATPVIGRRLFWRTPVVYPVPAAVIR